MSSGPRTVEGAIIYGVGAASYDGYMDGPGGGKPFARFGAYWGACVRGRWSLLGSLRTRRLAILTNRLGRRGGLFLEWASKAFGDGERRGRGELPEDNSSSAGRSISFGATISCLFWDGKEGKGEEDLVVAWPGWLLTRSSNACFLPTTDVPVQAVRPLAGPAPLVSLPILGAKGGTDLRG